jgi:hypothetical protein
MKRARAAMALVAIACAMSACSSCKKAWPGANVDPPPPPKSIAPSAASIGELDPKPPQNPGAHPRMLLTSDRLAQIAKLKSSGSPIWERLFDNCEEANKELVASGYEAWDWANDALSLAICFRVTNESKYAEQAVKYFAALLDDKEKVGDGKGG